MASRLGKARPVLAEIVVVDGVGTETAAQLEADALDAGHQGCPLVGIELRSMPPPPREARGEQLDLEACSVRRRLPGGVAPAPPGVAELGGQRHGAYRVEVDERDGLVGVEGEAEVADLEVPVALALGKLGGAVPRGPVVEDGATHGPGGHLEGVAVAAVEGALELGHAGGGVVDASDRRRTGGRPVVQRAMEAAGQAARRLGDPRARDGVEGAAGHVAEHPPAPALVIVEPEGLVSGPDQAGRDEALLGEAGGDPLDVFVHPAREDGVHPLQHALGPRSDEPGLVDEAGVGGGPDRRGQVPRGESREGLHQPSSERPPMSNITMPMTMMTPDMQQHALVAYWP